MIHIRPFVDTDWDGVWRIIEPVFRAGETYPYAQDISAHDARSVWISAPAASFVARGDGDEILGAYYIKPNQPGLGGHVCNCGYIAATMTSTGSPAFFLHPTDAAHGDLGSVLDNDAVLAFSRSGRAMEMITILEFVKKKGVPVILISENDQDSLAKFADVVLKMPAMKEAWGHAPTTSTIVQMAIGDALAVTLAQRKGFTDRHFHEIHPGGELGKKKF